MIWSRARTRPRASNRNSSAPSTIAVPTHPRPCPRRCKVSKRRSPSRRSRSIRLDRCRSDRYKSLVRSPDKMPSADTRHLRRRNRAPRISGPAAERESGVDERTARRPDPGIGRSPRRVARSFDFADFADSADSAEGSSNDESQEAVIRALVRGSCRPRDPTTSDRIDSRRTHDARSSRPPRS